MPLKIKVNKKPNFIYSIELEGSIDSETYQKLEENINSLISDETKAIVLDMSGVKYISSIGIKVILCAKKSLEEKFATFAMVNLQPQVKKIFDALKMLPLFEMFDEMPEADKYIDQIIDEEISKKD